jgi:hypothetical protein
MADNRDDSNDKWDVNDDALDAKLGLKKDEPANNFDNDEDLALKEQESADKFMQVDLKKKGSALMAKKNADKKKKKSWRLPERQWNWKQKWKPICRQMNNERWNDRG